MVLAPWRGVDAHGPTLQLVIMDSIPFARRATCWRPPGRGGELARRPRLLTVAATHASLLMALGAGPSLRSMSDKGVVAVLNLRIATARFGGFIRAHPPFWTTYDPEVVRGALKRLDEAQTR